jgi:hypothetical protein
VLYRWQVDNNFDSIEQDEASRRRLLASLPVSPAAVAAAESAFQKSLLALTWEQLTMLAAVCSKAPGHGSWLHASGIIGGGKTTVYEVSVAVAKAMGRNIPLAAGHLGCVCVCLGRGNCINALATAQTYTNTAQVGGSKSLEACWNGEACPTLVLIVDTAVNRVLCLTHVRVVCTSGVALLKQLLHTCITAALCALHVEAVAVSHAAADMLGRLLIAAAARMSPC